MAIGATLGVAPQLQGRLYETLDSQPILWRSVVQVIADLRLMAFGHEWAGLAGIRVLLNNNPDTTLQEHDRDVPWDEIVGPRLYFQ